MKKYYYSALIALLAFALNANAQENNTWKSVTAPEDTEVQDEGYNMVVTTPDGTTFTINTNDVDEVMFSNGQVTVSGTTIQGLIDRIDDLQWYLKVQIDAYNDLLSRINSCHCTTVDLTGITTDIDNLNDSITVHRTDIDNLADDVNTQLAGLTALINTLQTALTNGLNDKADKSALAALELLIRQLETQVLVNKTTLENLPDLSGTVADNATQIIVLTYAVEQLREELYNITSQMGSGQSDLTRILVALAGLQADMVNVKDLINYAINWNTIQDERIDQQQATIDAQQERITSLEDYVKALETRMATLEDVIQSMQQ